MARGRGFAGGPPKAPAYDYVRRTYGVDPKVGARVRHTETHRYGVIARERPSLGHYVMVRFDGETRPAPCHPTALAYDADNQHDDHCRLTADGRNWRILSMNTTFGGPICYVADEWSGERNSLDLRAVDWPAYLAMAERMMAERWPS